MELPYEIEDLGGYGEVADMDVMAKLTWDGLIKSVKEGYRTEEKALELFKDWFPIRKIED